jgi:hypothetical protein
VCKYVDHTHRASIALRSYCCEATRLGVSPDRASLNTRMPTLLVPRTCRMARLTVAAVLCASLLGCSILYDLSPDQCGATSECTTRFGKGFVCDDGLCKGSSQPDPSASPDVEGGTGPASGECQTHKDCLDEFGDIDPHVCVSGECVLLKSEECPLVLPLRSEAWLDSLKTSNAIILGAYSPIPDSSRLSNYSRFIDLAISEVTEEIGGLPGPGGSRRQVVVLVCEGETPSPEQLLASASHLVDELQVPGIVSTLQSADLQYVFEERGLSGDTFFMSALDADDALLNLQDNGLIWTMLTSPDQVAVTFAPLMERVLSYLSRAEGPLANEVARVALVAPTGEPRLLGDMGEVISDSIEFNGKAALDNYPDNFRVFDINTVYGDSEAAADQSALVSDLLDYRPHIILAMAANEFLSGVVPGLESSWADAAMDQPRPFYILSPYHLGNVELPAALDADDTVHERLVGVGYAAAEDPTVYRDYLIRLEQAYPEIRGDTDYMGLENFYDAPYYLLYALAAAGNPPRMTGSLLAQGMTRLIAGPVYEIGRNDMVEAIGLLQANARNSITLKGTLGLAKFDAATGARADAGSVFCVDVDGEFVPDVLRWDSNEATFTDADPAIGDACIAGF